MVKRMIVMLLIVGILLGLVFGFGAFRSYEIKKFFATLSNPVQTVTTFTAVSTPWQTSLSTVGSIVAINGANLSSEVSGIVDSIDFKSGEDVAAGTLLLTLRPNNDQAVLAQLQAAATLDQINYKRDVKQFSADAVSQAVVDTDRANLAAAEAQVQGQMALMAEKQVRAPFSGRLGIRQVDIGQYLTAGTQIVTLQQLNPLFVDFYLPQQALSQISVGQAVTVAVDAFAGQSFSGTISSINAAVDTATRTIQVRATIQNDGLRLRPGMFGVVNIIDGPPVDLVTVPQTAIVYNSYGDSVYLAVHSKDANGKDQLTAQLVFITPGDTRGDQLAVLKGVAAGDVVVTSGQIKLKNGSPLAVNNTLQPTNDPDPMPPNQ